MWTKFLKSLAIFLLACLPCLLFVILVAQSSQSFAQTTVVDSTSVVSGNDVLPMWRQIIVWVVSFLLIGYEVVVRLAPTSKSLSIISLVIKILKFFLPDTSSETKTISSSSEMTKNIDSHVDNPKRSIWYYIKKLI